MHEASVINMMNIINGRSIISELVRLHQEASQTGPYLKCFIVHVSSHVVGDRLPDCQRARFDEAFTEKTGNEK